MATGAPRGGPRRLGRGRLIARLLVAGAAALLGGSALGFAAAPRGAEPTDSGLRASRRGALLGGATALGLSPNAARVSAAEQWREDIPRALQALKGFQKDWAKITREGVERAGAEIVRSTLLTTYVQDLEIQQPGGQSVGATLKGTVIGSVADPNSQWMDGDQVIAVNGQVVNDEFVLKKIFEDAKANKETLTFQVKRSWPTPFTDLERKLQTAYGKLEDPDLPDLEAVQVRLGNLKALAGMAAGAPSSADSTLKNLKQEIDTLVTELEPVAKAIKA